MQECTFRKAVPGDEELLASMIRALARYERLEDQVVSDSAVLREWIFEREKAEVLFPVAQGTEAGYVLFFHNFSTFLGRAGLYLEDLFILPEYRGRGFGRAAIRELARLALERGCGRLEWSCLDWNQSAVRFYRERVGAVPMDGWTVYRLEGEALERAAVE